MVIVLRMSPLTVIHPLPTQPSRQQPRQTTVEGGTRHRENTLGASLTLGVSLIPRTQKQTECNCHKETRTYFIKREKKLLTENKHVALGRHTATVNQAHSDPKGTEILNLTLSLPPGHTIHSASSIFRARSAIKFSLLLTKGGS